MRAHLLLLCPFFVHLAPAQQQAAPAVEVLRPFTHAVHDATLDRLAPNARTVQVDALVLHRVQDARPSFLRVEVPYAGGVIMVELQRTELASPGARLLTERGVYTGYREGVHYRGSIPGVPGSLAAFSFFAEHVAGLVSSQALGNVVVGRLRGANPTQRHVIYAEHELTSLFPVDCGVRGTEVPAPAAMATGTGERSEKCVRIYYELMYAVYLGHGSDLQAALDWITAIHNIAATVYAADGITIALSDVFVWTTPTPYQLQDPINELNNFANYRTAYNGDVAHCINTGGSQGAANLAALCNRPYAGSNIPLDYEELPLYSVSTNMVAHETGHVLGSPHTHDCIWNGNNTQIDDCGNQQGGPWLPPGPCYDAQNPIIPPVGEGTIMGYCPGALAAGFGPQPAQRMLDHIAAVGCLGTDCITSCTPSVDSLRAEDVTAVSARINFHCMDPSITQWEIRILGPNLLQITDWTVIDTTTFIAPWLLPEGWHRAEVRTTCAAPFQGSFTRYVEFYVPGVQCGDHVTDSGLDGPWTNDCGYPAITILPSSPTDILTLTFSEFGLEPNADHLIIYNGTLVGGPIVADLTGLALPAPVSNPTPGGALTLQLSCDGDATNTYAGWAYTVSCGVTTGVATATATELRLLPTTDGVQLLTPASLIGHSYLLLDATGRTLSTGRITGDRTYLPMTDFARGAYTVQVTNGDARQVKRFVW